MMYICDKCGYKIELNEQGQFCPNCGNVLSILNTSLYLSSNVCLL